ARDRVPVQRVPTANTARRAFRGAQGRWASGVGSLSIRGGAARFTVPHQFRRCCKQSYSIRSDLGARVSVAPGVALTTCALACSPLLFEARLIYQTQSGMKRGP